MAFVHSVGVTLSDLASQVLIVSRNQYLNETKKGHEAIYLTLHMTAWRQSHCESIAQDSLPRPSKH